MVKIPIFDQVRTVLIPFRPLIFIGQSNLIDCVRDEGVKDGCRSEEVLEGR